MSKNIQLIRTFDTILYTHPLFVRRADQIVKEEACPQQTDLVRGRESILVSNKFLKQNQSVLSAGGYRTLSELKSVK